MSQYEYASTHWRSWTQVLNEVISTKPVPPKGQGWRLVSTVRTSFRLEDNVWIIGYWERPKKARIK